MFSKKSLINYLFLSLISLFVLPGCSHSKLDSENVNTMTITSAAFANNASIPLEYTSNSSSNIIPLSTLNISPQLSWSNIPQGTQSLLLMVSDITSNTGPNWLVYVSDLNLPGLAKDATHSLPAGVTQCANYLGGNGWAGPLPTDSNVHTYNFEIFALDSTLSVTSSSTKASISTALQNVNIIGYGCLYGKFQKAMTLSSSGVSNPGFIPVHYVSNSTGYYGDNYNPPLAWSNAPNDTKSFVLFVYSYNNVGGFANPTYRNWVVYNIPSSTTSVSAALNGGTPPGTQGLNENNAALYQGPCPATGQLTNYYFQVFALNTATLTITGTATLENVLDAMQDNILYEGHICASYITLGVYSSAFTDGGEIPDEYLYDGDNISPPLNWDSLGVFSNTTNRVRAIALLAYDNSLGTYTTTTGLKNWVLYMPSTGIYSLTQGMSTAGIYNKKWTEGLNSRGTKGWSGPNVAGHTYYFDVYALSATLNYTSTSQPTYTQLLNIMTSSSTTILSKGRLKGIHP